MWESARAHDAHGVITRLGAKVRIDTLEVLVSDLPRRELRLVLAWAKMHAAELDENWRRAREGAKLQEIEPLR